VILFDAGKGVKSIASDYDFTYLAGLDIFNALHVLMQPAARSGTGVLTRIYPAEHAEANLT
jgi:hypothetical protein